MVVRRVPQVLRGYGTNESVIAPSSKTAMPHFEIVLGIARQDESLVSVLAYAKQIRDQAHSCMT